MKTALVGLALASCSGHAGGFRISRRSVSNSTAGERLVDPAVHQMLNNLPDPQDFLAEGFGAIGDLIHQARDGQPVTDADVVNAAVGIGITVLGMVNPLLGTFATFLWGFVGNNAGADQSLEKMEQKIMKEVKVLIKADKYAERVANIKDAMRGTLNEIHSCCSPKDTKTWYEHALDWSERMNVSRGVVFGNCWDNPSSGACADWHKAADSLEYALMFAETHLHLDAMMLQYSDGDDKWEVASMDTTGRLYAEKISQHFNAALKYRTSADTFTTQTWSKKWRSYVPWMGKTRCDIKVTSNGWDSYSATAYGKGRGDCFQEGLERTCKKDSVKGNREKCGSLFPKWEANFRNCKSRYINEIKTVFKNKLRPAVLKLTQAFPQKNGQAWPVDWA